MAHNSRTSSPRGVVVTARLRAHWLRGIAWSLGEADAEERMVVETGYGIYHGNQQKSILHVV